LGVEQKGEGVEIEETVIEITEVEEQKVREAEGGQ